MVILIFLVSFLYTSLLASLLFGFKSVVMPKNEVPIELANFSVIIPFRNEEKHLPALLTSLKSLSYPTENYEVLFINDASTDKSVPIIYEFIQQYNLNHIKVYERELTSNSPKKDAVQTGIQHARFEWILTTDADCEVPVKWLQKFSLLITNQKPEIIAGPVVFKKSTGLLYRFQQLNFLSLMGTTIGSFGLKKPVMCNGANLCYKKKSFLALNGFDDNLNIASGDDVFLLEKFHKNFPNSSYFLLSEEAVVQTEAMGTLSDFINQQLRWAAKTTAYNNMFTKLLGLLVFSMNVMLIVLGVWIISNSRSGAFLLIPLAVKIILDFLLLSRTAQFLKQSSGMKAYPIMALIYPFFVLFIGIFSFVVPFTWKNRKFKK